MKNPRRYKVQCCSCSKIFNNDYQNTHEIKVHNNQKVSVKRLGIPENPFEAAKKKKLMVEVSTLNILFVWYELCIFPCCS